MNIERTLKAATPRPWKKRMSPANDRDCFIEVRPKGAAYGIEVLGERDDERYPPEQKEADTDLAIVAVNSFERVREVLTKINAATFANKTAGRKLSRIAQLSEAALELFKGGA